MIMMYHLYHLYTAPVGKVNSTLKLTRKFGKLGSYVPYDLVINYGTGSRKIKKKTLVDCTKFIQRDMDVQKKVLDS